MSDPSPRRSQGDFEIDFEGERLPAVAGETLAATLIANGRLAFSTDKRGRPRGLYCGMGVCHDCLVIVDGRAGERACLTKSEPGVRVLKQAAGRVDLSASLSDLASPPDGDLPARSVDLLVVGAGPAGLSAALAARRHGVEALVVDERPAPGGQYYKQPAFSGAAPDAQARQGRALIDQTRAAGVAIESATLVCAAERSDAGLEVLTLRKGRAQILRPRFLVVATGAFERATMVPGWTLPGAMTAGGAQTLVRSYGVAPGQRVVIAGNGPLNIQVGAELAELGCQVVVVEAAPPPWTRPQQAARLALADMGLALKGLALIARLKRAGATILWRHRLLAIEGEDRVARARLAPLEGAVAEAFTLEADAVLTGDGFQPAAEVARLLGCRESGGEIERGDDGATSQEDVYVVSEAGGFGGAHVALAQGELAGLAIARKLGRDPPAGDALRRLVHHRGFQAALRCLFAAPPRALRAAPDETIVCRCEAISLGELKAVAARRGVRDLATLKRLTRAGMGRCQGRYCAPALSEFFDFAGDAAELAPQAPLRPIPIASLAVEQPEWRGHKRALLPPLRPEPGTPLDIDEADTIIIGAGVAGVSTALFLARAGRRALVLDHAWSNSGASGGNAGSLHAQLLSFDFGADAPPGGGPPVQTLPLQIASIDLWRSLETELAGDFEIKITGGLMLAEDDSDLRFLEAKAAVERAMGVETHVIGGNELRALEPALDERFVGAAYCAQEGKINPLVATQALLDAAVSAGAILRPRTTVLAIQREANGYLVKTQRGVVRARGIVNAAGGFAAEIGKMLGLDVPVFGAPLQMVVTEAAEPILNSLVAHARRHLTLKQAGNGNFLIGGGWTAGLDPVRQYPRPTRASLEGNLWIAQRVLPPLRKLRMLRSWSAINIDIDGAPILGEHPGAPGFFNAVTSNGYTLGPIMGKITSELVLGGKASRSIADFGVERFAVANRVRP